MKAIFTIIFSFFLSTFYGQNDEYKILLDSAKTLFKNSRQLIQEDSLFSYNQVVSLLNQVIEVRPENAEAHYYLGYTYSRMNADDGNGMIKMNLELLKKSSEQFEIVNKLSPKYNGEIIILDPYSKLTSEWGSMAMSYWYLNKMDSAIWAFEEGKRRGGFGEFYLAFNRLVLDYCNNYSILLSSGDNSTFPLCYLQVVEEYRKDVSVADISMLNTTWYPNFLAQHANVEFDLPQSYIDTMEYIKWSDSIMTIGSFSWKVKPSYYEQYILRGDRVFLSMLAKNKFARDVYFTNGFNEDSRLSLKNYLQPLLIVDKLNIGNHSKMDFEKFKSIAIKMFLLVEKVNMNSHQELNYIDILRWQIYTEIGELFQESKTKEVNELLKLIDKYANEKTYPYQSDSLVEYAQKMRAYINLNKQ